LGGSCYKDNRARRIVNGVLRNPSMRSPRAAARLRMLKRTGGTIRRLKLTHLMNLLKNAELQTGNFMLWLKHY